MKKRAQKKAASEAIAPAASTEKDPASKKKGDTTKAPAATASTVSTTPPEQEGRQTQRPARPKIAPLEYPMYDEAAMTYMMRPGIPGAYSPILYIGQRVSEDIARLLGRPINVDEAMHLVSADGEVATCASEGTRFQPVYYLPFVPRALEGWLRQGKELVEFQLPLGGAYYVSDDNELVAFSGSVYHYVKRRERYEWNSTSPLVMIAETRGKQLRDRADWGVTYEHALKIQAARVAAQERRVHVGQLAKSLLTNRRRPLDNGGGRDRQWRSDLPEQPANGGGENNHAARH